MATTTLAGVTVLDLTSYLAGPYGATLLGDLGADVIKIEGPGGDMMRHYPSTLPGESRAYVGANRNKRGMVVDLKSAGGQEVFRRLVATADVVIENFRPGVAQRLGIDFAQLCAMKPDIVHCSLTGFGAAGPMADHPGFDQVLQCMTGIAAAQGAAEGEPHVVWGSVVDYYAASLIAMAVCAALYNRKVTGQAQQIESSLLRSALAMQAGRLVWARSEERHVERDLRGGRLAAIHPTKQGHLYIQAQSPHFWQSLCELTGLQQLASDPRYDDMRKRKEHEAELLPLLRGALMQRTALEWEGLFAGRVPCTVVRPLEDMFDHPQVLAEGLMTDHPHPTLGAYRGVTGPVRMQAGLHDRPDQRAPTLGEHTDDILAELDFAAQEITRLRAQGAVQ